LSRSVTCPESKSYAPNCKMGQAKDSKCGRETREKRPLRKARERDIAISTAKKDSPKIREK